MANNISDDLKKVLLAGIGAVALTAEKSKEMVNTLVQKGELTVEQGKEMINTLVQKGELTVEQGKEMVNSLVQKGELTVEQGKEMINTLVQKGELTVEQGKEMVNTLVQKGELTVEQGKALNEELKSNIKGKIKNTISETAFKNEMISAKSIIENIDKMSKKDIEALKAKLAQMETVKEEESNDGVKQSAE